MLYSGFNILPRSVFGLADFNGRSDNLDVIRLQKLQNFMNGTPNKRRIRFSIRSALLGLFAAAILLWVFGPASLRVHFGDLEQIKDQPATYSFTMKNYGPFPLYYRYAEFDDNFMVTRLDADSATPRHEGHKYAPWTTLSFLGETRVHEKYLKTGTRVGIQFRDIFGVDHVAWHPTAIEE